MSRPESVEYPLVERIVTGEIDRWVTTGCDLARASLDSPDRDKCIDAVQHLHLSGAYYTVTPRIVDALRRADLLKG